MHLDNIKTEDKDEWCNFKKKKIDMSSKKNVD